MFHMQCLQLSTTVNATHFFRVIRINDAHGNEMVIEDLLQATEARRALSAFTTDFQLEEDWMWSYHRADAFPPALY